MASLKRNQRYAIILGLCLLLTTVLVWVFLPNEPAKSSKKVVQESWDLMRKVGQYDFSSTVEQVTYPAAALANVGQSSTKEVYQISGESDLKNETLNIRMFKNQSSLLSTEDGVEIQIVGDKASGRAIGAADWEPLENVSLSSFSMSNDGSSYLASAKNVEAQEEQTLELPQTDGSTVKVAVKSYQFDVDPDMYATYMRDQMVAELQRSGKLPLGMQLSVSDQYREMVASGEIWINEQGMPVRMIVTMKMPEEENGDHVEATITTDYFNHHTDQLMAAQTFPARMAGALGLPTSSRGMRELAIDLSVFAGCLALMALILAFSSKKVVYACIAVLVVVSMLISPLWQSERSVVFAKDLNAQNAETKANQAEAEKEKEAQQEGAENSWDAHANPLEKIKTGIETSQSAKTETQLQPKTFASTFRNILQSAQLSTTGETDIDTDQDGLTDAYESQSDITVLNPYKADTDDDGLNDNVELKLNLFPGQKDTDGDGIWDYDEVRSFYYGDKDWYTNPEERDTDMDGQIDGAECPERINGANGICRDTDGDLIPDVFDTDDDQDGVPTINDESPYMVSSLTYSQTSPLKLNLDQLNTKPVFVNYQLIPTNTQHLTYAMNVLDWPSGDTDGQVQRISNTTYADTMTDAQVTGDPRSKYGDMRLIPMVEVKLTGTTYPLPLSRTVSVDVNSDGNPSSFEFSSNDGNPGKTQIKLTAGTISSQTLYLGYGDCEDFTDTSALSLQNVNDTTTVDKSLGDLVSGNYVLYMKDAASGSIKSCSSIPAVAHGKMSEYVIDSTILKAYGGAARNDENGDVLIYAPLSVVYDETGGKPVAFSARIPYTNIHNGFSDSQQEVRVVWLLNMLTDECKAIQEGYDETVSGAWCNASIPERWNKDVSRVVHTYTEEFSLAGLSVVEENGTNLAVIFENPSTDTDPEYDDPLWAIANGLEQSFIAGRSTDGQSLDLSVDEIRHRFDPDYNADITDMNKLWSFSKDTFRVAKYSYDTFDGMSTFIGEQATALFDTYFNVLPEANRPKTTNLLFAREVNQRSISLGESQTSCTANGCTVDFTNANLITQAMINWAPYQRSGDDWQPYDLNEYLDHLEAHLRDLADYQPVDDSADARYYVDGQIAVAKTYYRNLYGGVVLLVAINGKPAINSPVILDDQAIFNSFYLYHSRGKTVATVVTTVIQTILNGLVNNPMLLYSVIFGTKVDRAVSLLKALGKGLAEKVSPITKLLTTTFRKVALGAAIFVAAAGMAVLVILYLVGDGTPMGKWAGRILFAVFSTISAVLAGAALYGAIKAIKGVSDTAKVAAVIGAIIGTIIAWGVFIYSWIASGVSFGSLAFNSMVADAIAGTIVVVLMAALTATGVGAIIVAVIGLIDAVISAICALAGANELDEGHWVRQYVCIGITGWITKIFKWIIYSNTYLINYASGDRLSFNQVDQDLQNVSAGMTSGNHMKITVDVTNTITKSSIPIDWKAALYFWQFSDSNAKSSTFSYKVQPSETNIHDDLSRGDISGGWVSVGKSKWKQDFAATTDGYSIAVPETGINKDPVVYISEGSAVPVQECWAIYYPIITPVPIPICYIRTEKATVNSSLSSSLTVDVFPPTLDAFYALTSTNTSDDGMALAWGQTGNLKFPTLRDADGDGLMSKAFTGGNDPDDRYYDTDGDGLNDFYEVANGSDPRLSDTDDDGLSDALEAIYMTSPTRKDSDGDGLSDGDEILGWLYTYDFTSIGEPLETMVYSDPLMADSDMDGVTDYLEKVYGFNPRVPQDSDVLDYSLTMSEQDSPLVMLQFNEDSGAMVFADSSNYGFSGSCNADECPLSGLDGRYASAARFDGTDLIHLPTSAKTISLANNQPFTISAWVNTSIGGTLLSKWSDAVNGQQELRFEVTSGGNLQLTSSSTTITSAGTVPDNTWTHVAVTFDGSQAAFYIDGNQAGVSGFTNAPTFAAGSVPVEMMVGAYMGGSGPTGAYTGDLDELAYFNHALTADEISARVMTARYNFNDSLVRPGEEVIYHSTITNLLNSRFAYGLLNTIIDKTSAIVDWATKLLPRTFVLYPDNPVVTGVNTAEFETPLQIEPEHKTSEDVTITQTASAQIVDRRAESNLAELWLKLDETANATTFVDDSGNMPPRDATCTNCPASYQTGILNNAVLFQKDGGKAIPLPDLDTLNMLNRGYTVSMWVKPMSTGTAGSRITLLKSDSTRLTINLVRQSDGNYIPAVFVNGVNQVTSPWRTIKASMWSHLAVEYAATDGKLKVYINGGQILDVAATILTQNANLWLGGGTADTDFYVDDLRIFSRPLTMTDVNRLAERPVLDLTMDDAAFADKSVYNQSVTFPRGTAVHSGISVRGQSLNPDSGSNLRFLRVNGNSLLDMSDGAFTFSVWIYPTTQQNATWQGIFGDHETSSASTSYPSLERNGLKLRFGFGDGTTYQSHETANILKEYQWNHIVVTFESSQFETGKYVLKLYVNSVLKESKTFSTKPVSGSGFYVGTSSRSFTANLYTLKMDNEHDAGSHAEVYIKEYVNGTTTATPMGETSMADGDSYNVNYSKTWTNFENIKYTAWEADSTSADDNCGSFSRNGYDLPDTSIQTLTLSDGFDGSLTYQVTRPSIEFYGYIDEMQAYRYALDSSQVYDLFYANPITARLPLDDRPSSTYFENTASVGLLDDGTCSGTNCPAAGTIGLMNQAVRFDGQDDVISVPVTTGADYMVSLWLNTTCPDCGVYSLQNGADTYHQIYLKRGNVCSLAGNSEMCTQGGAIADGQWHLVIYSNDGSTADLWLDGTKVNSISGAPEVRSPGTIARLGYAPAAGNPTMNGQMDDTRIFRYVQDASVIAGLKQRAPIFLAHLDEADGSEVYDDATPNDYQLGCQGQTCPTGGLEGRLRQSVEFNENTDVLTLNQTGLSTSVDAFTASLWVYPTENKAATQSLITLANGTNTQPRYAVSLAPNSMTLNVQNAQNIAADSIPQASVDLVKNTWNMVTLVAEPNANNTGENYSLYINGYLNSAWASTTNNDIGLGKITLGNSAGFSGLQSGPFTGKLDEVSVYEYALNEIDIREMFAYQMGQVEESSSLTMTIDADKPSVSLESYNSGFPYTAESDLVLHVEASDVTSKIGMVEMKVEHVNAPSAEWTVAPVCQDAPGGTAFCPTFIPAYGEGIYSISFRAVDQVGNEATTPTYAFYVDRTAPKIFANLQNDGLYNAEPHQTLKKHWFLHMEGQVLDDTLSQGSPGSGLDLNSMKVTVYSENGEVVGEGEQMPALTPATNGYDWTLDYLFPEKEPTGALTVVIQAKDLVGNLATKTIHILMDASAPNTKMESHQVQTSDAASMVDPGTMDGKMISGGTVSGSVNDTPNDGIPYITADGKAASAGVSRVEAGFESSLDISSIYNEPYPKGLLAWLPLDSAKVPENAEGNPDETLPDRTFLDISPAQFAGVCSGENCPINGETGHKNGSIYFDGNEKSINLGQNVDLSNRSFSVLIWARRDASGHSDPILWQGPLAMAGQRFLFGLDYNDRIVCGFGGSDLLTVGAYPDTTWHEYACTYDQTNGKRVIYRDGQEVASDTAAAVPAMNENLFIGSAPVGSFAGSLDELMILDRALTGEEVREQYTGYQAVYHLTVEDDFLTDGDKVDDVSGYFHSGTLTTGEGDVTNKVTSGIVGNFSFRFDGDDRLAVDPAFSLSLDRGAFTQSAWIKPTGGTGAISIINEYDENPEQRYPSIYMTEKYGLIAGFGNFYDWNEFASADNVIQPDAWNFVTARFDGTTYSLFVNGTKVAETDKLAGMKPYPAERFNIGDGFVGDIDDVKIFTRALSDEEITAMSRSGWRDAALTSSGSGISWSAPVLPGLEGPYRVDARGWDAFNHYETGWNVMNQWSGIVDTLAPRIAVTRTIDPNDPNLAHYTLVAEDSFLDESTIHQNLCSDMQVTREYFNSSWFLASGVPPNTTLSKLTGTCSGDIRTTEVTGFYACDTAGNCAMQEFPPMLNERVYLPMVFGGGTGGIASLSPALMEKISPEKVEQAMQWALLTESMSQADGGQAPQVDILTSELTPADARSLFHTLIKGTVGDDSGITSVKVEILQNGAVVYTTNASVYQSVWNAVWFYPPGSQPANGSYTVRVTAEDAAGHQTSAEREISVHLLP